jgi:nitrite reductase/ring-hydroxylating ferredoxin subunit
VGLRELTASIERWTFLDGVSDSLAGVVNSAAGRCKSLLSGTWFGHPLHPALTDLPVGCWAGAVALDLAGGRRSAGAVDPLVGLGALASVPSVVTGLSDWADTVAGERRVGLVHGAANVTALGLFAASLVARRRARSLRVAGLAALGIGGYIGGHLAFAQGLGVDHQVFLDTPAEWVYVLAVDALEESVPTAVTAGAAPVMLYRRGSLVYAISDVCSHAGGPLHEGEVDADLCVTCPWHGSRFRLSDGRVVRGPATGSQAAYEARVRDGRVEVRAAR